MKKFIPVLIAIALIIVVFIVNFGDKLGKKYSYGTEMADFEEYFGTSDVTQIPIVLQDERIEEYAKLIDGVVYFDKATVKKYISNRFYFDSHEGLLLYTNANTTIKAKVDTGICIEDGVENDLGYVICTQKDDTLYIAADYIKKHVNYSYAYFDNPNRMQLKTEWSDKTVAGVKKKTQVRWKAGVKSGILREVSEGEVLTVLEELDDWTKVKTDDAFIGYVPHSSLEEYTTITETPVTEVPKEEFVSLTRDKKINLTWHNIEYPQGYYELYNACAKVKQVNVISPTWFWLTDNDGNYESVANKEFVQAAHEMGMEVWPLIANFHAFIDIDTTEVLSYTSKREWLVNSLVNQCLSYGVEGINIDFEQVPPACGESYVQFIRELSIAAHKNNLCVSVDNYVPTEYTAYYDRKEQGIFADYVIIMGYDEHYAGSEVGSVASIPWMRDGIENTLKVVPKEKVINAVPFYTRVWMTNGTSVTSEAVEMEVANDFIKRHGITLSYDEATNQNYGECTEGGTLYQVWMEDADSIRTRLNVMTAYDIAGVASWKLGQETPDIWNVIESYMNE